MDRDKLKEHGITDSVLFADAGGGDVVLVKEMDRTRGSRFKPIVSMVLMYRGYGLTGVIHGIVYRTPGGVLYHSQQKWVVNQPGDAGERWTYWQSVDAAKSEMAKQAHVGVDMLRQDPFGGWHTDAVYNRVRDLVYPPPPKQELSANQRCFFHELANLCQRYEAEFSDPEGLSWVVDGHRPEPYTDEQSGRHGYRDRNRFTVEATNVGPFTVVTVCTGKQPEPWEFRSTDGAPDNSLHEGVDSEDD